MIPWKGRRFRAKEKSMKGTSRIDVDGLCFSLSRGDADVWIAECGPLGIVLESESLDDIHQQAAEAVHLLLVDLVESGDLEEFLKERKWRMVPSRRADDERASASIPYLPWGMTIPESRNHYDLQTSTH